MTERFYPVLPNLGVISLCAASASHRTRAGPPHRVQPCPQPGPQRHHPGVVGSSCRECGALLCLPEQQ